MTQKKTEQNKFSLWDYPQLIDYLQKMALEGWMLEKYHEKTLEFIAAEPKQLKFAVSFFPEYVAGETEIPQKLEDMWFFAQMDGWQHITGNYHTQVFFNENVDCMPLHTDAVVQLKNYDSILKAKYLKRWKICAALSAVVFAGFMLMLIVAGIDFYKTKYMTFWLYSLIGIGRILPFYTLAEFIYNLVKIRKYKKWYKKSLATAKDNNDFIPLRGNDFTDKINIGISIGAVIGIVIQLFGFLWLSSFAKEAMEYVLNNPVA